MRLTRGARRPYSAAMDPQETTRLQEAWAAKGSPPCDHPHTVKERLNGMQTGDKVCTTCGEEFWAGGIQK